MNRIAIQTLFFLPLLLVGHNVGTERSLTSHVFVLQRMLFPKTKLLQKHHGNVIQQAMNAAIEKLDSEDTEWSK